MKDSYWFRQDTTEYRSPEIMAMKSIYGFEGYGVLMALKAYLREQEFYRIKIDSKYGYAGLVGAIGLNWTVEKFKEFCEDCANEFSILAIHDGCLFMPSLTDSMQIWDAKRSAGAKGGKASRKQNVSTTLSKTQAQPQAKRKQNVSNKQNSTEQYRTEENITEQEITEESTGDKPPRARAGEKKPYAVIPPTKAALWEYWQEKQYPTPECGRFWNYYESNGWKVGKNPMKNWHAAAANWMKNAPTYSNNEKTVSSWKRRAID